MNWTKERPTAPGWYWYRGEYAVGGGPQPAVVYVRRSDAGDACDNTDSPLVGQQPLMDYADPLEDYPGEWCGPIEPPLDPDAPGRSLFEKTAKNFSVVIPWPELREEVKQFWRDEAEKRLRIWKAT